MTESKKNQYEQEKACFKAALDYAKRGWPVIALHSINNGACTCGKRRDCGTAGKHPRWDKDLLPRGLYSATCDPEIISKWWTRWPNANVGIATGQKSFDALDVDVKLDVDGNDTLRQLCQAHGELPDSIEQITGGGGRQIFFKANGKLKNAVKFAPGLDIRTDGGLVVVPPSLHLSSRRYEWEASSHPDDVGLAGMPEWLIEIAASGANEDTEDAKDPPETGGEQLQILREKCKFINDACETRGNISESLWFAMISNIATIRPGGPDLCHEYSKGHPKYSRKETEGKIRHALNDTGPHTCAFIKRNGFLCGRDCGVKSPIAILRAGTERPKEPPRSLMREIPEAEPYPVDALGPLLGDAARAIHEVIQSPLALCCQSVLAAAALAVQPFGNVRNDGREHPLSCYFMTVAASGERKSATDDAALYEHRRYEEELQADYQRQYSDYARADAAFRKAKDEALKKAKGYVAKKQALDELGDPPQPPAIPLLLAQEPTYEGLCKALVVSRPNLGIFNDEGGTFLNGNAFNDENRVKMAGGLSKLWDGKEISRVRAGDGVVDIRHKRVSVHMMVQPKVASGFLDDAILIDQGVLSRVLTTWPTSTAGTRTYKEVDLSKEPAIRSYYDRMHNLLRYPLPVSLTDNRQLSPPGIEIAPDAKLLWVEFHNLIEGQLQDEAPLSPIRSFGNKAPQHVLRLAGILSLVEGSKGINHGAMINGIELTQHYLSEALRLFHSGLTDPQLELAQKLLDWIQSQKMEYVHLAQVYQKGPYAIRDAKLARLAMDVLSDHGWAEKIPDGMEMDGAHRREVWRIIHV